MRHEQAMEAFSALLLRWNRTVNLVGDPGKLRQRHIDDSLQLIDHIPPGCGHAIDLGSGGGFPGLVLALATGLSFHLIECDQRKAAFLREAARTTGAPVTVHAARLEDLELPPAPLVTARALAPLPFLLPLACRFLAKDGIALLLKGAGVDREIAEARDGWLFDAVKRPSRSHRDGVVLTISHLQRRPA